MAPRFRHPVFQMVIAAVAAAVAAETGIEQNAGYGTGVYGQEYQTEHYG